MTPDPNKSSDAKGKQALGVLRISLRRLLISVTLLCLAFAMYATVDRQFESWLAARVIPEWYQLNMVLIEMGVVGAFLGGAVGNIFGPWKVTLFSMLVGFLASVAWIAL